MEEFLYSTQIEIDYALKAYNNIQEESDKAEWERTRTQVYYMYLLTPSKKKKATYQQFKKDYLHLNYDDKLKFVSTCKRFCFYDIKFALHRYKVCVTST